MLAFEWEKSTLNERSHIELERIIGSSQKEPNIQQNCKIYMKKKKRHE
jgi:hypothetical protein